MRKRILRLSRRLIGRRPYTGSELLLALGIHRQTLSAWRKAGLVPVDITLHPWLYLGRDVKEFLKRQKANQGGRLKPDEFWCLRCRAARRSIEGELRSIPSGKVLGNGNRSVMIQGICEQCGCKIRKAGSVVPGKQNSVGSKSDTCPED